MHNELTDLQSRHDRLLILYQIGNLIHSTLEPQDALRLILQGALQLTRATSGSAVLINPTTGLLEIHASVGLPDEAGDLKLRLGQGITGWVAQTGKAIRVGDVSRDPRYVAVRPDIRSELAVPLEINGEVLGVLNVDSDLPEAFSAQDQEALQDLAVQAARVIHHTWLYEQFRLKARLLESLTSVSRTINSALSLDDALQVITREATVLMGAKVCSLMLLDDTRQWLDVRASFGAGPGYLRKPRLGLEDSLLGIVVRRKKPMQVRNVQTSTRYQNVEVARLEGLAGLLSVPLLFSGQAIGALSVYTEQPFTFSNEEIRTLSALAELSAIAIERGRLYERVVDIEEVLRKKEKLSALGLLAAEVAHEIRNPLTVMKMLYHSLDLQFAEGDPRGTDARIIADKMEHLNKIVEQILDFARTSEPQFAPVNLNRLVDELTLLVRHKLKNQNVQLALQLQPDLPPVLGEAMQLEQAFLNLILNAAEAMPQGGTLAITSRLASPSASGHPDQVAVDFSDTGQGMTAQQQRRAFGSVLNSTKTRGAGLGLAIVRRVVEAHNGAFQIESRPGKGTCVSVLLPADLERK